MLLTRSTEKNFFLLWVSFCVQLELVVLEFGLQGKSKGGEGSCEPPGQVSREDSWHLESGRTEPLGATVNAQNPPSPPQTAVEGTPMDFQLNCLGSSLEKEGQGCALSCALSSLQAPG